MLIYRVVIQYCAGDRIRLLDLPDNLDHLVSKSRSKKVELKPLQNFERRKDPQYLALK